ncbi:unnamed protein product [Nesidiocoris tenuis]|uniref:Uncharacterized protein n=1 Tax=Nesidiocoris tenuis TaxID=355587 RepID=A0A6H5GLU9_9HEMI|nr:unnamed protein product [Nesidiocoris tenuis]
MELHRDCSRLRTYSSGLATNLPVPLIPVLLMVMGLFDRKLQTRGIQQRGLGYLSSTSKTTSDLEIKWSSSAEKILSLKLLRKHCKTNTPSRPIDAVLLPALSLQLSTPTAPFQAFCRIRLPDKVSIGRASSSFSPFELAR